MIIQNNHVDSLQFNLLQNLISRCKLKDGSVPSYYPYLLSQKRIIPSNLLYFKNKKLIGFLSSFFFYERGCEIALMVDPDYRNQGIAKKLLEKIIPILSERQIETTIFSSPSNKNDGWFSEIGFKVDHKEYQMQRNSQHPVLFNQNKLKIQPANSKDIPLLIHLDKACFPCSEDNFPKHFESLLLDPDYSIFVAIHQDQIIGKSHVRWNKNNSAIFSDIAIFPAHQNQGFGKELVAYCIDHAIKLGKKKLILDVEPSNDRAVKLYLNFDFKISEERTFWTIPLVRLREHLDL